MWVSTCIQWPPITEIFTSILTFDLSWRHKLLFRTHGRANRRFLNNKLVKNMVSVVIGQDRRNWCAFDSELTFVGSCVYVHASIAPIIPDAVMEAQPYKFRYQLSLQTNKVLMTLYMKKSLKHFTVGICMWLGYREHYYTMFFFLLFKFV